jgi:ATP-dependent helicase/nuclease subunit A
MNKKKLVDEEAREKIKTALDTTLLVEAGAGSGKTHSLVDRMLALLASGRAEINTFAAVTFTRKAAAELRGRFQTELEKAVLSTKNKETHVRLAEALHYLEQCFIGTIHSFCAKILKERPIEIALDPDFKEMEEIEDAVFRESSWHDYLIKAWLENESGLYSLGEIGLSPDELKDAFVTLSLYPEVESMGGSDAEPDYESFRAELEGFLDGARERVPQVRPPKGFDDLQRLMHRCFLRRENLDLTDPVVLMETFEAMEKSSGITQNRWPSKEEAKDFKAEFDAFKESTVDEALNQWREYRHSKILSFLEPALDFYNERRLGQFKLNFQDQLMLASRLLRENPEVRQYFSRRFSHILVDEFQDTDPIQAEVLLYLTGTNWEEKDWQKLVPRAGSLFLVGDPKQSIFRFRRADIDTYNLVKDQILRGGGEVLHLTTNFRSLSSIGVWNNSVFEHIFPGKADRYQAGFATLDTVREDGERMDGIYKISIPKQKWNREDVIVDIDSQRIADFISHAISDDAGEGKRWQPSDFLILLRYKKNMAVYARALEQRGIPYEITGSKAFTESEEIQEISNLAKALNDPDNPIYTVAALRGLFFGVSDNELYAFKQKGGRFYFLFGEKEKREETEDKVSQSLLKLRQWWDWIRRYPSTTALEMIFEDSGVVSYAASSEMGNSRAGNLFKLLALLRSQEREGAASFSELVTFMDELVTVYDIEEMSLTPGEANAVRLMNLHKAKGLEAPFVFLANPVGQRPHDPNQHIVRIGSTPHGYFQMRKKTVFQWRTLSQPAHWEEKAEEEANYSKAEEERLMYVASTRARDCLVISAYEENIGDKRAWSVLDDRLQEVPELEIPEGGAVRQVEEREELKLKKGEWAAAKKQIEEKQEKANVPSYGVESVTSLAKKEAERPEWRRGSYGMAWGRAVHKMLEIAGRWNGNGGGDREGDGVGERDGEAVGENRGAELEKLAENILVTEELDIGKKAELVSLIESIRRSEFWERVNQAENKFYEVPFSIKTDGKTLGIAERESLKQTGDKELAEFPIILNGTIDLVFKEDDGWVIVDFKTDDVKEDLDSFVKYYSPQVELYSKFWAEITSENVKERGLYFTSINKWVAI